MAGRIRYHERFRQDLHDRAAWLRRNRPPQELTNLQDALRAFAGRVTTFPGAAKEVERRGTTSHRVRLLGEPLPYLVYYSYDEADEDAPVSLLMLLRESQDRERFDPSRFE